MTRLSERSSDPRKAATTHSAMIWNPIGWLLLLLCSSLETSSAFITTSSLHRRTVSSKPWQQQSRLVQDSPLQQATDDDLSQVESITRRRGLAAALATTAGFLLPSRARADDCGLEELALGNGQWTKLSETVSASDVKASRDVPATFTTYAARFLVNYDQGASSWWSGVKQSYSLLPEEERQAKLGNTFGRLARSIQLALHDFVKQDEKQGYADLLQVFLNNYGTKGDEAKRHIGLLFATLPENLQPTSSMSKVSYKTVTTVDDGVATESEVAVDLPFDVVNPPPQIMVDDLSALLPDEFECVKVRNTNAYTIYPAISLFEVGVDEEFGQTATATATGPLASAPLKRELPDFSAAMYTLFGISGAAGCALTHTVVIPLDVVKTRIQTDPALASAGSLLNSAKSIVASEGPQGLFLGAQATIAGYMWYGLSVYPSYTFFKRYIGHSLLTPDVAMVQLNNVALAAGACAAVVASLGLTPIEAARIRTVAEPALYRPKGLLGTLQVIATENVALGPLKTLYAGLPSLLTRQVIFGSIKFLAFERACEAIFHLWPQLHDETWTSLLVSLVAGGISGCLSSIVSQPADSVLTYVAQNSSGLGVLEGAMIMVQEEGVASLFRGLGSRCVWAGSIIAGQFLLYDVFRTYFGVSGDDLSQIYEVVIPR